MPIVKKIKRAFFWAKLWLYNSRHVFRQMLTYVFAIFIFCLFVDKFIFGYFTISLANSQLFKKNYESARFFYSLNSMYYNIFGYTRKAKIKKADIQYQIAKTYAAQGNQKDAMNALGTGVMYLQSDFGIYNRTVADYLSNQSADFFISVGDTNRAANVANQAQFIYNKVGITPNDTAALHRIYGKIAFVRNEYNNAFENYQNALDILRNTAEVNHSTYVKTILDIGEYYEHFNHSDLAISIYNEGIKKLDKDLVVAGHNRIALLIKLGKLYKATEKYNKAQPLYEEAIRLIEKLPRTDLLHASIDDLYTELLAIYGETKEVVKQRDLEAKILRKERLGI